MVPSCPKKKGLMAALKGFHFSRDPWVWDPDERDMNPCPTAKAQNLILETWMLIRLKMCSKISRNLPPSCQDLGRWRSKGMIGSGRASVAAAADLSRAFVEDMGDTPKTKKGICTNGCANCTTSISARLMFSATCRLEHVPIQGIPHQTSSTLLSEFALKSWVCANSSSQIIYH